MKGLVPVSHHSMFADFNLHEEIVIVNVISCNMNLNHLIALGQGPRSVLIQWLQRRDLLANPLHCAPCNQGMELIERNDTHVDGFQW